MKIKIFLILFFCCSAIAQDRARVKVEYSEDEENIKTLLSDIENSINNNDYKKYSTQLSKRYLNKNKNRMLFIFFNYNQTLTLEKFEILETKNQKTDVIVKYEYSVDDQKYQISSILSLKKQTNGLFVLDSEKIINSKEIKKKCFYGNCKED